MTTRFKVWLAVAFVVVFLAGVALGLFGGALHARHVITHGRGGFGPERMRQHLKRELQLTDEQAAKIDPVLERTIAQLEVIRRETAERVSQTMDESHREMAPLLTPGQRERLQQIHERHQRMMNHRHFRHGRDD